MAFPLLMMSANLSEWFIKTYLNRKMFVHPTFEALDRHPPVFDQICLFVLAAAVAPLAEEIFFRGILQTALIQYGWGFLVPQVNPHLKAPTIVPAARLSTLGSHRHRFTRLCRRPPADHRLVIFLLSVSLGYVYELAGNLWAPITLHALFNGVALIANP